jgi:hypothetical protein
MKRLSPGSGIIFIRQVSKNALSAFPEASIQPSFFVWPAKPSELKTFWLCFFPQDIHQSIQ